MANEVYVDLYFLVNASMDALTLFITAALLHRPCKQWRILLASVAGGGYAVLSLLLGFSGFPGFLADAAAGFLLSFTAFWKRGNGAKKTLFAGCATVLISMLLGGVMTGLYTLLNRLELPLSAVKKDGISVWIFAGLAAAAGLMTVKGGRWLGLSSKQKSVSVTFSFNGKTCVLNALVDSGNFLSDPVSGRGVIVADRQKLKGVFPPMLLEKSASVFTSVGRGISEPEEGVLRRVRLIPIRTATGESVLFAVVPDSLTVTDENGCSDGDWLVAAVSLGERASGFDAVISPN